MNNKSREDIFMQATSQVHYKGSFLSSLRERRAYSKDMPIDFHICRKIQTHTYL